MRLEIIQGSTTVVEVIRAGPQGPKGDQGDPGSGGSGTIENTTNLLKGDNAGAGIDSGIDPANVVQIQSPLPDTPTTLNEVVALLQSYGLCTALILSTLISQLSTVHATDFGDIARATDVSTLWVPPARTVNGHALSSNVTVTASDLSLVIGTNVQAWSANLDSWSALAPSAKQDADGDLAALAALSGTHTIYYRSASNTWSAVTIGSGLDFTGATLSATGGGGGSSAWGEITGTLSDQTDLQAALDAKANNPSEQTIGDAGGTWASGKTVLRASAGLTANRAVTLPAAAAFPAATRILYVDKVTDSASAFIRTFNAAGSDLVNGSSSYAPFAGPGTIELETDGSSAWFPVHDTVSIVAFRDGTDPSKQLQWDLSNIATGTTRTANAPNANATLAQAKSATSNQFLTAMSPQGVFTAAQAAISDISGFGTGVATFLATPTSANFKAAITDENAPDGSSSKVIMALGSLSIASGKTATFSNTLTFAGSDSSTLNIGAGGTLGTAAFVNTGTSGGTVPLLNAANTWTAGQKQTFGADATNPGIAFSAVTADPSSPTNGLWIRSDTPALKYNDGTSTRTVVNLAQAQTLTNKTVSSSTNTIGDGNTYSHDLTAVPNQTGGWSEYFVTGSDFTTTSTSLVDITGLVSGTLTAGAQYEFEAKLRLLNAADSTGMKTGVHGGGTGSAATVAATVAGNSNGIGSAAIQHLGAIDTATGNANVSYSGGEGLVKLEGFFTARTTGTPTMSIQILKVTSNTATVRVGSVLRIRLAHQ